MGNSVIFRGAYIRSFEFRNKEGSREVHLHITADWTAPVREHMEWEDAPEHFGACDLVGRLSASHIILTPNGKEISKHELQISADEVTGFDLVPVKDSEGEVTSRELRFTIKTSDEDAEAKLGSYCRLIGRGDAALKVAYEKQEELPLETPTAA